MEIRRIYFGEESSGSSSANDAAAVGSILQGVAAIAAAVGGSIATGVITESSIFRKAITTQNQLGRDLNEINKLRRATRDYRKWLNNSNNRKRWMTGDLAMSTAPKNIKNCPPRYQGMASSRNPGGHAYADPLCKCKTHSCAYSNPAKAHAYQLWLKKGPYEGWGPGPSNPPLVVGRGLQWRINQAREEWNYLMMIGPAQALWNAQRPQEAININIPMLTSPEVMDSLFPGQRQLPSRAVQQHWWNLMNQAFNIGEGQALAWTAQSTVPYWVLGFTQQEAVALEPNQFKRDSTIFNLASLRGIQRAYQDAYMQDALAAIEGGRVAFGVDVPAADNVLDVSGMKALVEQFAAQDAPPSSFTPQQLPVSLFDKRAIGLFTPVTSDEAEIDPIDPNYLPLAVGGTALLTGLFLRFRN